MSEFLKLKLVLFSVYLCFLIHYYYLRTEKVEQIHKKRRFIFLILGNWVAVISWSPWFKAFQGWQGWSPLKGKCFRLIKYLLKYLLHSSGALFKEMWKQTLLAQFKILDQLWWFLFFKSLQHTLYLLGAIIYKI